MKIERDREVKEWENDKKNTKRKREREREDKKR